MENAAGDGVQSDDHRLQNLKTLAVLKQKIRRHAVKARGLDLPDRLRA
jgi:hypothetical protein